MKLRAVVVAILVAVALPAVAGAGSVVLQEKLPKVSSTQVSVTVRKAAAFNGSSCAPATQGRTRLFLLGKHAPKGGALIDTATYACDGTAGSFYCQGQLRAAAAGHVHLPRRVRAARRHNQRIVVLTVRW